MLPSYGSPAPTPLMNELTLFAKYRKQMADEGKTKLEFYSIVCDKYEVIQAAEKKEETEKETEE